MGSAQTSQQPSPPHRCGAQKSEFGAKHFSNGGMHHSNRYISGVAPSAPNQSSMMKGSGGSLPPSVPGPRSDARLGHSTYLAPSSLSRASSGQTALSSARDLQGRSGNGGLTAPSKSGSDQSIASLNAGLGSLRTSQHPLPANRCNAQELQLIAKSVSNPGMHQSTRFASGGAPAMPIQPVFASSHSMINCSGSSLPPSVPGARHHVGVGHLHPAPNSSSRACIGPTSVSEVSSRQTPISFKCGISEQSRNGCFTAPSKNSKDQPTVPFNAGIAVPETHLEAAVIGWEMWYKCHEDKHRPLREVVLKPIEADAKRRIGNVRVVQHMSLLAHLPDAFDKFCLVALDKNGSDLEAKATLRAGFKAGERPWNFFCGKESRRVYAAQGSREDVQQLRERCFPGLHQKPCAKQLKYMGLLTSQLMNVVNLPDDVNIKHIEDIKDKESGEFCFTDGCGYMSPELASLLRKEIGLETCPSVWQIRYCGHGHVCKGVLLVCSRLSGHTIQFRKSMLKAKIGEELESLRNLLGLVKWSKPYAVASLTSQAVALLTAAVPNNVIEDLHGSYLSNIMQMATCPASAAAVLALTNQLPLWRQLRRCGGISIPKVFRELLDLRESLLNGDTTGSRNRLHIPVLASRMLFGACDPGLELREGTCFVRVAVGDAHMVVKGPVIVYRSPSYSPGDVRVLQAVDVPGCQVAECILFSAEGTRPAADMMSGGDLDGDQFAIFWDSRLTSYAAKFTEEPLDYSPPSKPVVHSHDMIEYLFASEDTLLGRIDGLFWSYAAATNVASEECKKLALIFSRAVDKLPEEMKALEDLERRQPPDNPDALWSRLLKKQAAKRTLSFTESAQLSWQKFRSSGCWDKIPCEVVGSLASSSLHLAYGNLGHSELRDAVASYDGVLSCPCYRKCQPSGEQRCLCKFDCEDPDCMKDHPSPQTAAVQWRARAEQVLTHDTQTAREYRRAQDAMQGILNRLNSSRETVCKAEDEAYKQKSRSAMSMLSDAVAALYRAWRGEDWHGLNEKVRAKEVEIEAKKAALEGMKKRSKAEAARLAEVKWIWSKYTTEFLRGPFDVWHARAHVRVLRKRLGEEKDATNAACAILLEEKQAIEAKRDMHFSEEAYEKAKMEVEKAAVAMQGVDVACRSFCARVARLLLDHGSFEQRVACNRELRLALEREQRRAADPKPVFQYRADILDKLTRDGAVVVTAGTGTGKSTQIPGYLVDDLEISGPVVCTQPRRVAAKGVAERVAYEFGTELGDAVGYHVGARGSKGSDSQKKSENTMLLFVTDGLLLHNQRQHVGALVIDEAHERGRDSDLLLARWRRSRNQGRDHPPLVVMSASINASRFAEYLECSVVEIPGKMHKVQEYYKPLLDEHGHVAKDLDQNDREYTAKVCQHACDVLYNEIVSKGQDGDVLIFLPGKKEIQNCVELIKKRESEKSGDQGSGSRQEKPDDISQSGASLSELQKQLGELTQREKALASKTKAGSKKQLRRKMAELQKQKRQLESDIDACKCQNNRWRNYRKKRYERWIAKATDIFSWSSGEVVDVYPLYSTLPACDQDNARLTEIRQSHKGKYVRKVVCCTNIAETSLTIEGVRFVIDAGLARQVRFDHILRCSSLCLDKTAQAAAIQRKGRAGRVSSGWCYMLFSKEDFDERPKYEDPEMLKTPVEKLLLYLLKHDIGDLEDLGLLDTPPTQAIRAAKQALIDLRFLAPDGKTLTEDGRIAADLDIQPWSTRMLLESKSLQCTGRVRILAALLEELDVQWRLEHAEFFAPQGDPFSLLHLWDGYLQVNKTQRRRWCEERQLSLEELDAVHMRLNRMDQILRNNKWSGSGDGTDDEVTRAFVRGYFQFFAVHHDKRFPRAGYSVLTPLLQETPTSDEQSGAKSLPATFASKSNTDIVSEKQVLGHDSAHSAVAMGSKAVRDLLKIELGRQSTLQLQAQQPAPWAIFTSLRSTSSKPPYTTMSIACAVEPEVVLQEAPMDWQKRVRLREHLEGSDLALLKRSEINQVGPGVMRHVLRERRKLIKKVEHETNSKVLPVFELSTIFIWGSLQEVSSAHAALSQEVELGKEQLMKKTFRFCPGPGLRCLVGLPKSKIPPSSAQDQMQESATGPCTSSEDSQICTQLRMEVLNHTGDVRGPEAAGRQAAVFCKAPGGGDGLIHALPVEAARVQYGDVWILTFNSEEACQRFLACGVAGCHVKRALRTDFLIEHESWFQEEHFGDLEHKYKHLKCSLKRGALCMEVVRAPDSNIVCDQRPQLRQWLKENLAAEVVEATGNWKSLQRLQREAEESSGARICLEPGRFLIFGERHAKRGAKTKLKEDVKKLLASASETVPFGEGLAALQGPAGSVFAAVKSKNPDAEFEIDMERRLLHIKAPCTKLSAAVDSVHEALAEIDGRELPVCSACTSSSVAQLLLCGCSYCEECFSSICMQQCNCGSPILPSDVLEVLSERGKPIFVKLLIEYLENLKAPAEYVRLCSSCHWPYLALSMTSCMDSDIEESCSMCSLDSYTEERCSWCSSGCGSPLDLKFKSAALGEEEWNRLLETCSVEKLGFDWWRFKGSAHAQTEAMQLCDQWTAEVSKDLPIPAHTEEFMNLFLRSKNFAKYFSVKCSVKHRRVKLEGFAARVQRAAAWFRESAGEICSRQLAITADKQKMLKGRSFKTVKELEKDFYVCIWIGEGQVFISGFPSGIDGALVKMQKLLADCNVFVPLPVVGNCIELSWKFLQPSLRRLRNVVHDSSGPDLGKVRLVGPLDLVQSAEKDIREQLRTFSGRQVPIEGWAKAVVIGKKGATLNKLQAGGVSICIGKDGDDAVYVGGPHSLVEDTVNEVLRLVQHAVTGKGKGSMDGNGKGSVKGNGKASGKDSLKGSNKGSDGTGWHNKMNASKAGAKGNPKGGANKGSKKGGHKRAQARRGPFEQGGGISSTVDKSTWFRASEQAHAESVRRGSFEPVDWDDYGF